jgi:DNA-binding SARP family transcriptional activator
MDQPWQIELFGWLRATQGDRVVSRFRTQRAGSLLAYLAYHRDRSHPREALIERLWPESDPHLARASLRTELNSLRRQLEPPGVPSGAVLLATRATLRLNPEACRTDVSRFEAALQAAGQAQSPAARAQQLATAASLYRGELLPGYFEAWVLPERQRLAEAFLHAVHELVELLEELGDLPGALQWARRAVAADPLGEENHHSLIRLLLASGQVEAARVQFEQGEELLLRELGVGLDPDIRSLVRDLAPSKDRPAPVPGGKRGHRSEATQGRHCPAEPEPGLGVRRSGAPPRRGGPGVETGSPNAQRRTPPPPTCRCASPASSAASTRSSSCSSRFRSRRPGC